jgi:hypothetical protein
MADDVTNDNSLVTSITLNVIAGLDPAIHPLRKILLKFDGYAGQARV